MVLTHISGNGLSLENRLFDTAETRPINPLDVSLTTGGRTKPNASDALAACIFFYHKHFQYNERERMRMSFEFKYVVLQRVLTGSKVDIFGRSSMDRLRDVTYILIGRHTSMCVANGEIE